MVSLSVLTLALVARGAEEHAAVRWWSHIAFLADDRLEGRDTGSPGYRKAAEYVAGAFAKAGLAPAGTDGFFQPVQFRVKSLDEPHSSLTLIDTSGEHSLNLGEDAFISLRVDPAPATDAELVFAGYGLANEEAHHNDFEGLDVRGKLVVLLSGAPADISGPLAAHMQSSGERGELLRKLGAAGTVTIQNPKNMDIPWDRVKLARFMPSMKLADPTLDDNRGLALGVFYNPAKAESLFEGTGHTFAEILAAADAGKPLPHFAMGKRLKASVAIKQSDVISDNVVGLLPGTDPKLKDEYVVYTAHLDHVGVGKPVNGDTIYNGAMDNAAGIATMIEVATALKETKTALRRSVLFVAVTGEEKGLQGSRYFANFPTVPAGSLVANINTDMFLPIHAMKRLTIQGIAESDVGTDAAAVARKLDLIPQADPEPKRNSVIRSDQYSFILKGIPAIALAVGYEKGSPEETIRKNWLTLRYHAPSDDLSQPVDRAAAARFNQFVTRLLEQVANRDERPRWKADSFFKRFAR